MTDTTDSTSTPAATDRRYSAFDSEDGLVVYDRTEPSAWLQSDTTVDLDGMV